MLTNEEILIRFFQKELEASQTNEIKIGTNNISSIGLTEKEIIQTIFLLQEDDFLSIKGKSIHNDFSMYWTIALKSKCVHYFDDKKDRKIANKREWIRTYIPISVSILALLKSFSPEIITIMGELSKLIKQLLK